MLGDGFGFINMRRLYLNVQKMHKNEIFELGIYPVKLHPCKRMMCFASYVTQVWFSPKS